MATAPPTLGRAEEYQGEGDYFRTNHLTKKAPIVMPDEEAQMSVLQGSLWFGNAFLLREYVNV